MGMVLLERVPIQNQLSFQSQLGKLVSEPSSCLLTKEAPLTSFSSNVLLDLRLVLLRRVLGQEELPFQSQKLNIEFHPSFRQTPTLPWRPLLGYRQGWRF